MLRQRVITAVVLLALLLPALFAAASWPFALLTLAMICAAGWEWGRLNGLAPLSALGVAAAVLLLSLLISRQHLPVAEQALPWRLTALAWALAGGLALKLGPEAWPKLPLATRWLLGIALLAAGWNALTAARGIGINFLLSAMALVWTADIAAYFGGRRFGRRKLAPSISPGKSWEGAVSGVAGVVLLALLWLWLDAHLAVDSASVFSRLKQLGGIGTLLVGCAALAALSVVGDLFESLVKRAAGAKDSSALLPGHGGVLDRIDALLPVLPAAMAVATW